MGVLFKFKKMDVRYFVHKTDSYKNNKRKLAKLYDDTRLTPVVPYNNGPNSGFYEGEFKNIDEDTLNKYWNEISRDHFFCLEIMHIPN